MFCMSFLKIFLQSYLPVCNRCHNKQCSPTSNGKNAISGPAASVVMPSANSQSCLIAISTTTMKPCDPATRQIAGIQETRNEDTDGVLNLATSTDTTIIWYMIVFIFPCTGHWVSIRYDSSEHGMCFDKFGGHTVDADVTCARSIVDPFSCLQIFDFLCCWESPIWQPTVEEFLAQRYTRMIDDWVSRAWISLDCSRTWPSCLAIDFMLSNKWQIKDLERWVYGDANQTPIWTDPPGTETFSCQ